MFVLKFILGIIYLFVQALKMFIYLCIANKIWQETTRMTDILDMRNTLLISLVVLLMYSCSNHTEQKVENRKMDEKSIDTLIGKNNITNEISGSAYRKQATEYFVIILPYSKPTKNYYQRLSELELILPVAASEYNIDSLKSIFFGRLVLSGDLAILVTQEYKRKFGDRKYIATKDYHQISEFILKESTFVKDLNRILEPYSKQVSGIDIEKVFFTSKDVLLKYSKVSKDTTLIPEKVIDFMLWVNIK